MPRFSTSCWAVTSPVAKRITVVTLWVSSGRAASLALYLDGNVSQPIDDPGSRKQTRLLTTDTWWDF